MGFLQRIKTVVLLSKSIHAIALEGGMNLPSENRSIEMQLE
jgi:hypothetical protein